MPRNVTGDGETRAWPHNATRDLSLVAALIFGGCMGGCNASNPSDEDAGRVSSAVCVAPARPSAAIELVHVFTNLELETPVALQQATRQQGEPSGRWYVVDQHGLVHSFYARDDGTVSDVQTSDFTGQVYTPGGLGERGLLGLALHPRFPNDSRVFLDYTADDGGLVSRVSSFEVYDGVIDTDSEIILLQVSQPHNNHNGGNLLFGPDGYLYVGLGDGGSGGDPHGHGQNTDTLLGSILRIDVDGGGDDTAYAIPEDNPFVDGGGRPEIYAYGLRNPWRFSFDRQTGELWAGDVGQDSWEEIDVIEKGGNHGWNVWEGKHCFPPDVSDCEEDGFVPAIHEYRNPGGDDGRSVTGGYVYRGAQLPELVGKYIFADYLTGEIWQLEREGDGAEVELLLASGLLISSFAEGQDAELYVLDRGQGRVLRIDAGDGAGRALPARLTDTGCVDREDPTTLVDSLIPYEVAVPFWSDGVDKERYMMLPEGETLDVQSDGDIEIPRGAMLIKNFRADGTLFETRFYVRHDDGEYSGYSYKWNSEGTNAELVETTHEAEVAGRKWVFPGRGDCNRCHTAAAGRSLGLELKQLDIEEDGESQLERLTEAGAFSKRPKSVEAFSAADSDAPLEERARAYLHVNCSSCHRPAGPTRVGLDLRFERSLAQSGLCETAELGDLDTADGAYVAPGSAADSVVHARMARRDEEGMPPLATTLVDEAGAELLSEWIEELSACE